MKENDKKNGGGIKIVTCIIIFLIPFFIILNSLISFHQENLYSNYFNDNEYEYYQVESYNNDDGYLDVTNEYFTDDNETYDNIQIFSNGLNIWLSSDWHIGKPYSGGKTACDDANDNMDIDIAFVVGDYVNGPCGMVDSEWVMFYDLWDGLTGTGNIIYKNEVLGNHEGLYERWYCDGSYYDYTTSLGWAGNSRLAPKCFGYSDIREYCYKNQGLNGENYTFQYGNILFIVLPSASYVCYNGESGVANTSIYVDWVNQTIQKNQDKNIIVLCHYGIDTGRLNYYDGILEQDDYYWMMQNYKVFAWIHGHTHEPPSVIELYGTYHINTGVIQKNKSMSIMLNFTDKSNKVNIVKRNHDLYTWSEIISGYDVLELDYDFDKYYSSIDVDAPLISNRYFS